MTIEIGSAAVKATRLPGAEKRDTIRVWMVDDNDEFRGLLSSLLSAEEGFVCEQNFASGADALTALEVVPAPDVVLLDIEMRGECGLDAIRPIRAKAAFTRVLMLTTCFDNKYRNIARSEGASDFLLKSFSLDEIAARIQKAMQSPIPEPCQRQSSAVQSGADRQDKAGFFSGHPAHPSPARWHKNLNPRNPQGNRFYGLFRGVTYLRSLMTFFF